METVEFGDLADGEKFEYGNRLYEKDEVPDSVRGIIENAICLEDLTGAMFEENDEVLVS